MEPNVVRQTEINTITVVFLLDIVIKWSPEFRLFRSCNCLFQAFAKVANKAARILSSIYGGWFWPNQIRLPIA